MPLIIHLFMFPITPIGSLQSLFFHVQGLKAIEGVVPYLKQHKGVFVTASGTGFYEQCFPSSRCGMPGAVPQHLQWSQHA